MPGKRIRLDDETWLALRALGRDTMADFQELADEAFRDLLRKHNRPVGLAEALKASSRAGAVRRGHEAPRSRHAGRRSARTPRSA